METLCSGNDVPLLMALPLLYKMVMSSASPKQYGLTKTQVIIMSSLAVHGTLRMSQIADYIFSSKEQATRAIAGLVDLGYVDRYHDTENRTRVYVHLTDSGRAFLDQCRGKFLQNLNTALDNQISPAEKDELQQAAECIVRILSRLD